MEDKQLRDKIKDQLRAEHVKLWDPPYTFANIMNILKFYFILFFLAVPRTGAPRCQPR